MPEKWILRQYQSLPLRAKIAMSRNRIVEWYEHFDGNVFISFSGGKDSTVLSYLVHDIFPDVPLVFANTGLEYPEIQDFAKKMGADFVRPSMSFPEVISTYGYPIISKENAEAIYYARRITDSSVGDCAGRTTYHRRRQMSGIGYDKQKWVPLCRDTQFMISNQCCYAMKKSPINIYQRKHRAYPYIGTLAEESKLREQSWIQHGCNEYKGRKKSSHPLSFWTEQDILHFIWEEGIEIASVYKDIVAVGSDGFEYEPSLMCCDRLKCTGCQNTGCIFCGFGCHLEKGETRFQRLAKTHPRQYEYCMGGGQWVDNPVYDPVAPKMDGDWVNWNPKKIWVPSKEGLGMKKVFDDCNQIYGKDFIRYE